MFRLRNLFLFYVSVGQFELFDGELTRGLLDWVFVLISREISIVARIELVHLLG
jgi:hypothetical protein